MIKAVIFDLGGVYFTNGTKIAIAKISKKYKIKKEDIERILLPGSEFGKLYRQGKITGKEFFKKLKKDFGIRAKDEELIEIWFGSYKPVKDVIKTIARLKKKGFKVYFLSDNVKDRAEFLEARYNFSRHFIEGIFSHKAGMTKFDGAKIFRMALRQTGEKPENVIFVDDNERHVEKAKDVGMNAIHFKNPKQFETAMKRLI